MYYFIAFIPHF